MDATKEALAQLDDPNLYDVKRGVPIFRPHERDTLDSKGKPKKIVVTSADLQKIVDNMAKRQRTNGVCGRVTDGHIVPRKDSPEGDQPPLLGYIKNPRKGTFGPENVPCVYVDTYTKKDAHPILENRPFRSSEYYDDQKDITGLAMMVRDPFLDLGIVNYEGAQPSHYASNNRPYLYAWTDGDAKMADDSDMGKAKTDEDMDLPAEEAQHYAKFCSYAKRFMKGHPKLYGMMEGMEPAAPAKPGMPGAASVKPPEEEPSMNAKEKDPVLYARLEALEKQNTQLLGERERSVCEQLVDKVAQHYKLDRTLEIKNMMVKTPAEREAHIAYIKATHMPQDEQIQIYSGKVEGNPGSQPTSPEVSDMAVNYAGEHGLSYEAALIEVRDNNKRPSKMPLRARKTG